YHIKAAAPSARKAPAKVTQPSDDELMKIQELPWDWDSLATPRLKNLLESLPGPVPGTVAAPLTTEAEKQVARIPDPDLEEFIWKPALDPARAIRTPLTNETLVVALRTAVRELIRQDWRPLIIPAGKAPQEARRYFNDPSQTVYTLLLARPFLDAELQGDTDRYLRGLVENLPNAYSATNGRPRVAYETPLSRLSIVDEPVCDDLARLYPLWLWSQTPAGKGYVQAHWPQLRARLQLEAPKSDDDCGNARLAGLLAYCRMARTMNDASAVENGGKGARQAMRDRRSYAM